MLILRPDLLGCYSYYKIFEDVSPARSVKVLFIETLVPPDLRLSIKFTSLLKYLEAPGFEGLSASDPALARRHLLPSKHLFLSVFISQNAEGQTGSP